MTDAWATHPSITTVGNAETLVGRLYRWQNSLGIVNSPPPDRLEPHVLGD